jgi:hypothetical protein
MVKITPHIRTIKSFTSINSLLFTFILVFSRLRNYVNSHTRDGSLGKVGGQDTKPALKSHFNIQPIRTQRASVGLHDNISSHTYYDMPKIKI